MKITIAFIIAFSFFSLLFAQSSGQNLYVLHFADKGVDLKASVNPSLYLADKSVERRLKHKIAFDQSDIPVNETYVQEISKTGVKVLTRSRWFNTIVVEARADLIKDIALLPYIAKVQSLGNSGKTLVSPSKSVKPFFESEMIIPLPNAILKSGQADIYEYGAAFNQINQIKGQYLHNMGFSGEGMTIAVLDAGFNSVDVMPCFNSLRANNQIKGTRDFAQPGNNVYATTMHSHGSSVLSCMAANISGQMVGTAPKADYWLLRSEVAETESIIEEYYWVAAAEFADSVGVDLINSSLGYTTFDNPATNHTYAQMDGNTTVVTKGADKAAEKGILVVNSAGNSGGVAWKFIGAPADGDSVFAIGAVNATGIRANFSSVGPTSDGRIKPTVAAQGAGTALYYPLGLGSGSGTSYSSPVICGITACLWQAFPGKNNMQIIEMIKASASKANQPDSLLGWGIPDYQQAVITNQAEDKALMVYPNPFRDKFKISFLEPIGQQYLLEIFNLQGSVVYKKQRNDGLVRITQINDIEYLPSGIYFIRISDRSITYSGKIIKW